MGIVRKAVMGMMAVNRLREGGHANTIGGQTSKEKEALREEVEKRKQEAEHVSSLASLALCPALKGADADIGQEDVKEVLAGSSM